MSADELRRLLEKELGRKFKEDLVPRKVINDYACEFASNMKDFMPDRFGGVKHIDLATALIMAINNVVNENVLEISALNTGLKDLPVGLN